MLDADGTPPKQTHLTEDERRLVEGLTAGGRRPSTAPAAAAKPTSAKLPGTPPTAHATTPTSPKRAANRLTNPDAVLIDLTEFVGDLEGWLGEVLLLDQDWLQECVDLLRDRPQLIFCGPPGTGKAYVAQELAKHLTGGKPENTQLVQFHPSYSCGTSSRATALARPPTGSSRPSSKACSGLGRSLAQHAVDGGEQGCGLGGEKGFRARKCPFH